MGCFDGPDNGCDDGKEVGWVEGCADGDDGLLEGSAYG